MNHKLGADGTTPITVKEVDPSSRNRVISAPYSIDAYVKFNFPGRPRDPNLNTGPDFKWEPYHFTGVDWDDKRKQQGKIYLIEGNGKRWNPDVSLENGNYDYLMGADIDFAHPEVRGQMIDWGTWYVKEAKLDGFRIDAVKHISSEYIPVWIKEIRKKSNKNDLFAVGEYWSYDTQLLDNYLNKTNASGESNLSLFDAPLHNNFYQASKSGGSYDMRKIFDGSLVQIQPTRAVTLVENHDTQPLQALESSVESWFKPLAYGLILLRSEGYPCVFLPDLEGAKYRDKGRDGNEYDIAIESQEKTLKVLLDVRKKYAYGAQRNYLDDANIIGWTREGNANSPNGLAVLMSDGPGGTKRMELGSQHSGKCYINAFKPKDPCVKIDSQGFGVFATGGGTIAVYTAN